jgi:hypothetical protein
VQGVITSRIDRLPATQQLTIKVASAIGRLFPFETLCDVHPFDLGRAVLIAEVQDLERIELLRTQAQEPELLHAFRHILTQQITYDLLPFEQRRELHARIASFYERKHEGALSAYYPLLAHHFRLAEVPDKAMQYLEGAATQALRAFANREAVRFLSDALKLAETDQGAPLALPARRARWHLQLGEAFHGIGDMARACTALRESARLLELPAPERPVLPILGQLAKHLRLRPDLEPPKDAERFLHGARAYELLSVSSFLGGDIGASRIRLKLQSEKTHVLSYK